MVFSDWVLFSLAWSLFTFFAENIGALLAWSQYIFIAFSQLFGALAGGSWESLIYYRQVALYNRSLRFGRLVALVARSFLWRTGSWAFKCPGILFFPTNFVSCLRLVYFHRGYSYMLGGGPITLVSRPKFSRCWRCLCFFLCVRISFSFSLKGPNFIFRVSFGR